MPQAVRTFEISSPLRSLLYTQNTLDVGHAGIAFLVAEANPDTVANAYRDLGMLSLEMTLSESKALQTLVSERAYQNPTPCAEFCPS